MEFQKRAAPVILPAPVIVENSGFFRGDDGKWSTFNINIGGDGSGNGQDFEVIVSTSSGLALVPLQTEWCDDACAKDRGVLPFDAGQPRGLEAPSLGDLVDIPMPAWFTGNLTTDPSGNPGGHTGFTNVGLGLASSKRTWRPEQVVVGYTDKDFYVGWLGLAVGEIDLDGKKKPNLLDSLYGPNQTIPSRSFGYSAGASYRNNGRGVPGSLVLGGYDATRLTSQRITTSMPNKIDNTLAVGVQSIVYEVDPDVATYANTSTWKNGKNGGFEAVIDSTLPYLILPDYVCDNLADRFRLSYDIAGNLYTVNKTARDWNIQQNATVTLKIGNSVTDPDESVYIRLPYLAFDLQLSYPKINETSGSTQYFPIKRSEEGKYVLGRTFLQEAYIIINYENATFTVAEASLGNTLPPPILVPIFDQNYKSPPSSGRGLGAGAIAGIVVGIATVFIIAGVGAFMFWRKRQNSNKKAPEGEKASEFDTTFAGNEVKQRCLSELTGSEAPQSPKESTTGYYNAERKSIPPISELSPESPPAELHSPDERETFDYFMAGRRRQRGVARDRDSLGNNTPRMPIAELSGEDVVRPNQLEKHGRSPSGTSLSTNIDEVLAAKQNIDGTENVKPALPSGEPRTAKDITNGKADADPGTAEQTHEPPTERRPSHTRGLSDVTIQSDSTAVSQPSPEELERWAASGEGGPPRPMSP